MNKIILIAFALLIYKLFLSKNGKRVRHSSGGTIKRMGRGFVSGTFKK